MGLLAINPAASTRWACFRFFFFFAPYFLLICSIVRLLLLLGSLSKMGINIEPPKHMDCSCNSYANTYANFFPFFFFFCGFFKRWTSHCFLFFHEQAYLFEFSSLAVILKCNLRFTNAMLFLMADPLPPSTSILFVLAFSFSFPHTFPNFLTIFPLFFSLPSHLPQISLPITFTIQFVYHVTGEG